MRGRALYLALVLGSTGGAVAGPSSHWAIDPAHTKIAFSVDATGFPRTEGVFRQFDGEIGVDLQHPEKSRVGFRVEARSLEVDSDLLADLLRGKTFLDTDRYADITFTSTGVEKLDEHSVRVTGALTLLGVTQPMSVDVEVRRSGTPPALHLALTAKARIDRLAFGMREGYPLISKDVDLVVSSEAVER